MIQCIERMHVFLKNKLFCQSSINWKKYRSCHDELHTHAHIVRKPLKAFSESVLIVALKKSAQISYNFPITMNNPVIPN